MSNKIFEYLDFVNEAKVNVYISIKIHLFVYNYVPFVICYPNVDMHFQANSVPHQT